MAEVKNSFLGSKMNQDLDDRLIPNNQYREGVNISVSNSEQNDVGAIETVLGNNLLVNLGENIIGNFVDQTNNTIYFFTTDYEDTSNNKLDNFAPGSATCKIYSYNVLNETLTTLVQGFFLNFSTTHPIYGVNLLEDLLFWTDDRNQPRKINVKTATDNNSYYTTEDHISVAKYAPYQAIQLYQETATPGTYETTMKDVTSATLPDGTANPDLDTNYAGDPDFLHDKFVRFSYRFKFDDGEYSIMAPFTQTAFIPKQDGSFIDKYDNGNLIESDEQDAYKSTIVKFMENKVDNIKLIIPLEYQVNQLKDSLKIKEIEVLYKESDSAAVKLIDTIDVTNEVSTNSFYEYDYQSTKPTRVLPEDQVLRVYDKVPVRALGQEIISNRIVYSNYINKHTAPSFLDYSVNVSEKLPSSNIYTSRALEEYPEQTLKQNRNYQVGIVLSDRYGRQSGVILAKNTAALESFSGLNYGSSTIYAPFEKLDPKTFDGNSLKLLFNSAITSTRSPLTDQDNAGETGEPGLYNSNNPLGWYSYKVVVKQTEQEYYNVYVPDIISGNITTANAASQEENIAFISLINDNINKVPRDLEEVGPDQKNFRSSIVLYPRVDTPPPPTNDYNEMFDVTSEGSFVGTIATIDDLTGSDQSANTAVYQAESNPLIGKVLTPYVIGKPYHNNTNIILGILETEPVESQLDIYWETSTTGLISELNQLIADSNPDEPSYIENWSFSLFENNTTGTEVSASNFQPKNNAGQSFTSTVTLASVTDGTGADRSSDFTLTGDSANGYNIETTVQDFYYGTDAATKESYSFDLLVTNTDVSPSISKNIILTGSLSNIAPTIDPVTMPETYLNMSNPITVFTGENGAIAQDTRDLSWTFDNGLSQITVGYQVNFYLQPFYNNSAQLTYSYNSSYPPNQSFDLDIVLTDAGGLTDTVTVTVDFAQGEFNPSEFTTDFDL